MAEPVGDLVVDLSLDAARFDEQMARVRRHFSGTESDAKKTAAVVEQSLSRQALAAQKAGISVGQYKAAMRMLPAQFTDVATQLAGGQSPWLILLQQGGQVKDSFGGMMLTGSEQNWRSFTRSVLSMMTEILLKQAMVGIVGSIGSAIGGAVGGGASASGGTAIQAAAAKFHFATGGFTGTGGKYEPAGIVHRGEFVFTKEATSRIGVGNLYRLMRGYATGGYVGGTGSPAQMRRSEGIRFEQNNNVVIQNDGTNGLPGPQMMKAVYDMARKGARDEIQTQMRDGGLFSGGGR
ncbi:phage tail length tape measure protein [Escherichia coli]|uniref:phage tail tape measure protein n=1 Tax=Escherichia coli TaxID=562 RepID=UPI0010D8853E|nr:phage tail tape measure protein [Escherichia coli]GCS11169.1 phage tail length tape measure protein [Escherichia coli]